MTFIICVEIKKGVNKKTTCAKKQINKLERSNCFETFCMIVIRGIK